MYVLKITRSKLLRYQLNSNMTLFMRTFFFQNKVKEDLQTDIHLFVPKNLTKISLSEEKNQTNIF